MITVNKLTKVYTGQDKKSLTALKNISFKLVSGDLTVTSVKNTFAMRDLSSYVGMIPAGQSVETVLLFEVSEDKVEDITEPNLQIIIGSETKNVIL